MSGVRPLSVKTTPEMHFEVNITPDSNSGSFFPPPAPVSGRHTKTKPRPGRNIFGGGSSGSPLSPRYVFSYIVLVTLQPPTLHPKPLPHTICIQLYVAALSNGKSAFLAAFSLYLPPSPYPFLIFRNPVTTNVYSVPNHSSRRSFLRK